MTEAHSSRPRPWQFAILVLGLLIEPAILYGPALLGQQILLPLDLLMAKGVYAPASMFPDVAPPAHWIQGDELTAMEMWRRFSAEEVRAGRLPLWNPYCYCGHPFVIYPVLSPFRVLDYLFPSPVTIAWTEVAKSLVAGLGAYAFFRRSMGIGFWASCFGAWIFPLCGFLALWRGQTPSFSGVWLPWALVTVDAAIRRPLGLGGVGLALTTMFVMIGGHPSTGAHVMLAAAAYFLWRMYQVHGVTGLISRAGISSSAAVVLGVLLGIFLSCIQLLPMIEYLLSSQRFSGRLVGNVVERPPSGWREAVLFVLPFTHGGHGLGKGYVGLGNQLESGAQGYTGLLVAMLLAPLAISNPRYRATLVFWLILGGFAASFTLNTPLVVRVFDWAVFRALSNNRFVFITAWAILVMGVVGLQTLSEMEIRGNRWYWLAPLAIIVVVVIGGFIATKDYAAIAKVAAKATDARVGADRWYFWTAMAWLGYGGILIVFWSGLITGWIAGLRGAIALGLVAVCELVYFGYGLSPMFPREMYFPKLDVFEFLASAPQARVVGINCLPANLSVAVGLRDIRGYDSADPASIVALLDRCRHKDSMPFPYTALQNYRPKYPSPILDLLNVQYLLARGTPPGTVSPLFVGDDYWIVENTTCLPRPFVPKRIENIADSATTLDRLASPEFNPADVAFTPIELKNKLLDCKGTAQIVEETPTRIVMEADMETPGMVVLSDLNYAGWTATVNGKQSPIVPVDYCLRGVEAPAGKSIIVQRFEPLGFSVGLKFFTIAVCSLVAWILVATIARQRYTNLDPNQNH